MVKQLDASEISNLWTTYTSNSASVCLIRVFLHQTEDKEIISFLEEALYNAEKSVAGSKLLLEKENYPLSVGVTEADINLEAPRLFSDKFMLFDIKRLSEYGMIVIGLALNTSNDKQVRDFYSDLLTVNIALFNRVVELCSQKKFSLAPLNIPIPEHVEYLSKESAFKGLLGKKRTINGLEIKEIVSSLVGMIHGQTLLLGFSQVAQIKKVREHFIRVKEVVTKHIEVLQAILKDEDLPTFPSFEGEVTQETEAPFSDKLMMLLITLLSQLAFARYGIALSQCSRNDILADITRLMAETAIFLKDGTVIMMENSWLEQPPTASDREALANK
jgi:hypothetical protein